MKNIRIRVSDSERSCAVDTGEMQAWSKALIDEILFETAKHVSARHQADPIAATITFQVVLDREDGTILIAY